MMDAIENSLISACKNHFGTSDNIKVIMDRETLRLFRVWCGKEVVEEVFDPALEISLEDAGEAGLLSSPRRHRADPLVESKSFGRIATQKKNLDPAEIREEERKAVFDQYFEKEKIS